MGFSCLYSSSALGLCFIFIYIQPWKWRSYVASPLLLKIPSLLLLVFRCVFPKSIPQYMHISISDFATWENHLRWSPSLWLNTFLTAPYLTKCIVLYYLYLLRNLWVLKNRSYVSGNLLVKEHISNQAFDPSIALNDW